MIKHLSIACHFEMILICQGNCVFYFLSVLKMYGFSFPINSIAAYCDFEGVLATFMALMTFLGNHSVHVKFWSDNQW